MLFKTASFKTYFIKDKVLHFCFEKKKNGKRNLDLKSYQFCGYQYPKFQTDLVLLCHLYSKDKTDHTHITLKK